MQKFTNPLDNIKIAAPCEADWDEMRGDERKRYCALCKLNVYNLSNMTQIEAENFLINAEGRLCLRIFRRSDGTVITKNCPVGLARIKKKISQMATAVFSLIAGFTGGVFALESLKSLREFTNYDEVPDIFFNSGDTNIPYQNDDGITFGGGVSNLPQIKVDILKSRNNL